MSTPKSVIKMHKSSNGSYVEYTSDVDAVNYYLFELSRAAMRDVGKFVARKFRDSYYAAFNRIDGRAGRSTRYRVFSSKNTKYPRVEIGLKGGSGSKAGWWGYLQEFGALNVPKLGLLTKAAQDNVAEIIRIESQYLSGLSGEAEALEALIDEGDAEGNADE